MILITTYYEEKNSDRRVELLDCLNRNIVNPLISQIHIISENVLPPIQPSVKVKIVKFLGRSTFRDLIEYANNLDNIEIKIIANTDIYFNQTLSLASKIRKGEVYCLTRWDDNLINGIEYYQNFKSQDAWIFRSKLPHTIGDYFMGLPGCDNRFAFELYQSGLKVLNPSFDIQIIHLHNTNLRNYSKVKDKVKGNYFYPLPIFLESARSKQLIRIHYLLRRKYHSEMVRGTLEGIRINTIKKLISKILVFYYKLKLQIR